MNNFLRFMLKHTMINDYLHTAVKSVSATYVPYPIPDLS